MPSTCAAYGCTSRGVPGSNIHFFRFPSVKRDRQRREAWIRAVRRQNEDGSPWEPSGSARLCEKHFVKGSPSNSPRHPDYVPSLFVYTDEFKKKDAFHRYVRTAARMKQHSEHRRAVSEKQADLKQDSMANETSSKCDEDSVEMEQTDMSDSESTAGFTTSSQECEGVAALLMRRTTATAKEQLENVSTSSFNGLLAEHTAMKKRIQELEVRCKRLQSQSFSVDTIHSTAFKFYTGLTSKAQFDALYGHLEANAQRMAYWVPQQNEQQQQIEKDRQLSKREELFMVLYRLRTGVCAREVARLFGISQSSLSRIFCSWINILDKELYALTRMPSLAEVQRHMPEAFSDFPNTRVVLDCTEVRIQKSSKLKAQRQTFSTYKHFNTFKALVGVTPDGYVCFVPEIWGGHVSDTEIVERSGLLKRLQPGDGVMVDKGFRLDSIFPPTIQIYIPPFKKGNQLSASDVIATRKIAGARIHVERVIRRIKEFHFLDRPVPINMLDIAGKIFRTCALLSNLQPPIIAVNEQSSS
ncbi:uncharacterized protein LOC125947407 [Dermacentor silvarum]|uniref:uncharacterized protein LOC125947407 n=1 Tax=Dermacentor silvarum TaxID=543639 RepID=UPI002101654D|nr:uncharacterized protein LOC125947407 [Dermacentor silvarum]